MHFAADPDNMLCGRVAVATLCGEDHYDTTNWDAGIVTCPRCLEVMEERAVGVTVTQVHDETIIRYNGDPWDLPGCAPDQYKQNPFDPGMWSDEMLAAYKKQSVLRKMMELEEKERLARVKKLYLGH